MNKKLDLFKDIIPRLDLNDLSFYENLTDSEKKQISPFILLKFMSSSQSKGRTHNQLITVNELVNKRFWSLIDYPNLQWKLLALCGSGKKEFHYFPGKQKGDNNVFKFIQSRFPYWKDDEIEMFLSINSSTEIIELAKDMGLQDKEIKELEKDIKNYV